MASAEGVGGSGGFYVSFTFGDEIGVGYGAEALVSVLFEKPLCSNGPGYGIGPMLQLGGINASKLRFVTGVHGGGELEEQGGHSFDGELGVALHRASGLFDWGVHTGFTYQTPVYVHTFARAEWLLDEYSVGSGARVPPFGSPSNCQIGRPLRAADGQLVTTANAPHVANAIASEWMTDAQSELASVPAFLQLAQELLDHSAPDDLIEAALDAAADEIRHAELCTSMARRYADVPLPTLPTDWRRPTLPGKAGLKRLAVESWLDGALNEGRAAEWARGTAASTPDIAARDTQAQIANDESRHAELGWRILQWACATGGDDVRHAVDALKDVDPGENIHTCLSRRDALRFGRAPASFSSAAHDDAARARLATVLRH